MPQLSLLGPVAAGPLLIPRIAVRDISVLWCCRTSSNYLSQSNKKMLPMSFLLFHIIIKNTNQDRILNTMADITIIHQYILLSLVLVDGI